MNDDKDKQDNHRVFHDRNAQKLHRINQRKEHYFTQALSDDEDDKVDKVDEYDSGIFPWADAQNLHRIKQRKERCFIQVLNDDEDDQDDDLIAP